MFGSHSIRSLVLTGLSMALFPLAVVSVVAILYVDKLAEQSQIAVVQAMEAAHDARLMINQITAMERNVRQYLVAGDEQLLEVYRKTHAAWRQTATRLARLNLDEDQRKILDRLHITEKALFEVFGLPTGGIARDEAEVAQFLEAQDLASEFLAQSAEWMNREVAHLQTLAGNATQVLGWVMVIAFPFTLGVAVFFAVRIVRPLQHIAGSIQQLSKEDFATPITVRGPRDLEELGRRLDGLRERLAEIDEQKAGFLRHMSHELKTPLASLHEGTELLADGVLGSLNPDQREVAAILYRNSLHLQKLVGDLLDFNQVLSRNLRLHKERLDMAGVIRKVIEDQRLLWAARDIRVTTNLAPLRFVADREKLAIMVDNLLSNAIKFSPVGGTVRIMLKAVDGMACLDVRDSGPGFDPQDGNRVFEAFYQGRTVADSYVSGSGLGLAIVREYAAAHRGSVEIVKDGAAGGWVRLRLPLK